MSLTSLNADPVACNSPLNWLYAGYIPSAYSLGICTRLYQAKLSSPKALPCTSSHSVLCPNILSLCAAFGVVRNPYSLDRSTAGSSGGPAAGATASYAMISFGTDTGNSIRGPSGHQGLVGLRSSIGQTSRSVSCCRNMYIYNKVHDYYQQ